MSKLAFGVLLLAMGCAVNSARYNEEKIEYIKDRASFEMSCPKEKLSGRPINQNNTQFGIVGCGKKAVYIQSQSGWKLDSLTNN